MSNISKSKWVVMMLNIAGAIAGCFTSYAFIKQLEPDISAYSDAVVDVDISQVQPGGAVAVKWRGSTVVIKNRTEAEIETAKKLPLNSLKDKLARNENLNTDELATDLARSAGIGHENWIVYINKCTHLGCPLLDQMAENGRIYCPCHGSVYDTAGRIISGPAPQNLEIPPYHFISPTTIRIG